jgi:hypothetical protein
MASSERERHGNEVEASLAARRELGPEFEPELIEGFLERLEQRVGKGGKGGEATRREPDSGDKQRRFVLAIISLGVGIPITAIAVSEGGLVALVIVWLGIVLVNAVASR